MRDSASETEGELLHWFARLLGCLWYLAILWLAIDILNMVFPGIPWRILTIDAVARTLLPGAPSIAGWFGNLMLSALLVVVLPPLIIAATFLLSDEGRQWLRDRGGRGKGRRSDRN